MFRFYREDGFGQQVYCEIFVFELKKFYLVLSDKKGDFLKVMIWFGKNINLFFECFDNF